jgi:hypothetical protein
MLCALLAVSNAFIASALILANQDEGKRPHHPRKPILANQDEKRGKLIHLKLDHEYVHAFGFELASVKNGIEIASADEWHSLDLGLCKTSSELECSPIHVPNSEVHPEKMRHGTRMSVLHFSAMLPTFLRRVDVDILYVATNLRFWTNPVLDSGPVSRLEFRAKGGEQRLFSSTLMAFLSLGNTVLALTTVDGSSEAHFAELRRGIELRAGVHRPPLLFFFGSVGSDVEFKNTSLFPKECVVVSTDYWTSDPQIIHATPDQRTTDRLPIMTTNCHAEDLLMTKNMTLESTTAHAAPLNDYIFVYGQRVEIGNELLAGLQRELMLPVVVLSKREECPQDLKDIGVTCIEPVMDVAQFHQILRGARIVISESLNKDNPTLLEAPRCGTPVLVHTERHTFLDRQGEKPHVLTWRNTSELFDAAHEAMKATSMGNHKLAAWTPAALRDDVMRDRVENLLLTRWESCLRGL